MTEPASAALAKMDELEEQAKADTLKFVVFTPAGLSCWISEKGVTLWKDGAAGKRIRWSEALMRITNHFKATA